MVFNSEWVRRMGSSRFNYWFGYVANITLVMWLGSHGLYGGARNQGLGLGAWLGYVALGLCTWTFLEYVLHRFVYHEVHSFLSVGHGLHHQGPKELIGVPWYLTSALLVGIFYGLSFVFTPGPLGVVMASTWLGYVGYCLLHHGSHHWRFASPYLRAMKQHHLVHHAYPETNWGFTTSVWDKVFGTYRAPKQKKVHVPAH